MADADRSWPALVALAVHELRSPVSVVSGYVKMLLDGYGGTLSDAQRQALEQTDGSGTRLADILADLSAIGRLESGRLPLSPAPVTLDDLLAEAVTHFAAPPGATVRCLASGGVPGVGLLVDRARVARGLGALAAHLARKTPHAPVVLLRGAQRGHSVVVTVANPSVELTDADLDPLGALDESVGGLGVSVPLARRVIEAAGGRVGVPANGTITAAIAVVLPQG